MPPQQEDWWTEALIGQDEDQALSKLPAELVQLLREEGLLSEDGVMEKTTKGELPPELMNIVRGYFEGPAMSKAKAKEHRQELMDARTDFQHDADELWKYSSYNFCEH